MVNQAEEPLTKVTLNLFEEDVEFLKQRYPSGWTQAIRVMVRNAISEQLKDERNS